MFLFFAKTNYFSAVLAALILMQTEFLVRQIKIFKKAFQNTDSEDF